MSSNLPAHTPDDSPIDILLESSKRKIMEPGETQESPGSNLAGLNNQKSLETDMTELCIIQIRISQGRKSLQKEKFEKNETGVLAVLLFQIQHFISPRKKKKKDVFVS